MKSKAIVFNKPAPLSKRQLAYLNDSTKAWFNVAEGG